jgi:omega-6 fatty acid desaturase (delta-12 desaturase)
MAPPLKPLAKDASAPQGAKAQRAPTAVPPFTVADLRRAIPAHCFERSLATSLRYLAVDLAVVGALLWAASFIDQSITADGRFGCAAPFVRYLLWTAYWIVQGCVMTGLWVIGHECGHGGFSDSELVNDVVGFVTHSGLLVPYFSWKVSHRRHHSNTGNLAKDEVFVPSRASEVDVDNPLLFSAPVRLYHIVVTLTVGWFGYLFANASGRAYPAGRAVNHFLPSSPIFSEKERPLVVLSDLGLLAALGLLYAACATWGVSYVAHVYVVPYLIVNFWLVLITLLQHTDAVLPHYEDAEWDWLRGALATVDRDYGILNKVFHHIGDTHVTHHIFSSLPHYHAEEATRALIPVLGSYYCRSDVPIARALWKTFRECSYVEEEQRGSGVLWFVNGGQRAAERAAARDGKKAQ